MCCFLELFLFNYFAISEKNRGTFFCTFSLWHYFTILLFCLIICTLLPRRIQLRWYTVPLINATFCLYKCNVVAACYQEQTLYYLQDLNAVDFTCFTNAYFNSYILYQVIGGVFSFYGKFFFTKGMNFLSINFT